MARTEIGPDRTPYHGKERYAIAPQKTLHSSALIRREPCGLQIGLEYPALMIMQSASVTREYLMGAEKSRSRSLIRRQRFPPFLGEVTTHDATHNKLPMHVLGRTYAAVRDLQVVEGAG
jgi:hypothetical protein